MMYTLWSHGVLLGESELNLQPAQGLAHVGTFYPAEEGRALLPLFSDAMAAVREIGPMLERQGITAERLGRDMGKAVYDTLRQTAEGRRVAETGAAIDALRLELRGPDGSVVPTQQVLLQDSWALTPEIAALPPEAHADLEAEGFMRYLLCVIFNNAPERASPGS
jgi:hypothetical protein